MKEYINTDTKLLTRFIENQLRNDKIPINFNGHHGVNSKEPVFINDGIIDDYLFYKLYDNANWAFLKYNSDAETIYQQIYNGELLNTPICISNDDCSDCGCKISYWFTGQQFTVQLSDKSTEDHSCSEFGGLKSYSVDVEVPSGTLIFANNLKFLLPEVNGKFNINLKMGVKQTVLEYADHNVLSAYTGNTCPTVYAKNNHIIIGNLHDDDDETQEYKSVVQQYGKPQGYICTDLWWFFAMDKIQFEHLVHKCINNILDQNSYESKRNAFLHSIANIPEATVNVEPGTYRMTMLMDNEPDGYNKPIVEITKI